MSKYIVELFDGVQVLTGVGASPSGTVWSRSYDVDELEELNSDYINKHFGGLKDEAYQAGLAEGKKAFDLLDAERDAEYQKGFEDGKKSGYEKGLNAVGTYRKGYAIGYEEGYEDGKNSIGKGCDGCRYESKWQTENPCKGCSNCYTNKYEPMPKDEICFGDEIVVDGERGVVVSRENEESDTIWALFNGYRTPQIVAKNNYAKTGRHFDIEEILEAMRK